jgi:hypothetical protein
LGGLLPGILTLLVPMAVTVAGVEFGERLLDAIESFDYHYVKTFYNRTRHQAALEHRTPSEVYAAALAG